MKIEKIRKTLKCVLMGGAALALAASLLFSSCNNGSPIDEYTELALEVYDDNKVYTVTKADDGKSFTIAQNGDPKQYSSVSIKPAELATCNTLTLKITNNDTKNDALVKIDVVKSGTEANNYEPTPAGKTESIDSGEVKEAPSGYGNLVTIPAGGFKIWKVTFDSSKSPDKINISMNSSEASGNIKNGNITVSDIKLSKSAATSGGGTGDGNGSGNGNGSTTPTTGTDIVFDFTKVPSGQTAKEAFSDYINYCSASASQFSSTNGLTLNVSGAWEGALKLGINQMSLTNKKIKINYKVSSDWSYTDTSNNKMNLCLVEEDGDAATSWNAKKVNLGDFGQGDAASKTFTEITIDADSTYGKNWETGFSGADLSKIIAIKINTQSGNGTLYIKSIKFVD